MRGQCNAGRVRRRIQRGGRARASQAQHEVALPRSESRVLGGLRQSRARLGRQFRRAGAAGWLRAAFGTASGNRGAGVPGRGSGAGVAVHGRPHGAEGRRQAHAESGPCTWSASLCSTLSVASRAYSTCGAPSRRTRRGLPAVRPKCYTGGVDALASPSRRSNACPTSDRSVRSPWAWIPTLYLAEGLPVRRGDDGLRHHVQAARDVEHGHRALHELALPAVGDQAALVAGGGHPRHATAAGSG